MNHDREGCLEWMRPEQIQACRERADVVLLPLGTLEWHGVQNPIGVDGIKSHSICQRAVKKLGGGAVSPPLMLGVPRDSFDVARLPEAEDKVAAALGTDTARLRGFAQHGGMDIQEQWLFYQRLLRMTLEQLAGFGFRSIYICSGHSPLVHWVRPVAITFARASRMAGSPVTVDFGGEFEAAGLDGDHGGLWETSLMMAADPACVDLDQLRDRPAYLGVASGKDAVDATIEQGQAWAEQCADAIAGEARWLVDHHPEQPPRHRHRR